MRSSSWHRRHWPRALVAALVLGVLAAPSAMAVGSSGDGERPELPVWPRRAAPNTKPLPRVAVAPMAAPLRCDQVVGYTVDLVSGSLFRFVDSNPNDTTPNAVRTFTRIGAGWDRFPWVAAGGDGVIYALTWSGDLLWYRHNGVAWTSSEGRVIGTGFIPEKRVANLTVGANGDIYIVRSNGRLALYRHTGRLTGAATWANPRGWDIGAGWLSSESVVSAGDGVIYRQVNGELIWYRHTDPALARATWRKPSVIGTGWWLYSIASAGAGRIYVTKFPDPFTVSSLAVSMVAYQHNDPLGGRNAWSTQRGVVKGVTPGLTLGITIDPSSCRLVT